MKRLWLLAGLALVGCGTLPPPSPGGAASVTLRGAGAPGTSQTSATVTQPANPSAVSTQNVERQESRQEAAPVPVVKITETPTPAGIVRVTEQFSAPLVLTHTVAEKTSTALGAAHRDDSRTIAAKLASFRPVQIGGLVFLVFTVACFNPVVRRIAGGGKTVPAIAGGIGLVLIFGPALFVGHETLALICAVVAFVGAFLVVRLSHKEGQLDASK